jgi:hypothetical protein
VRRAPRERRTSVNYQEGTMQNIIDTLDHDGRRSLAARINTGERCLEIAWGSKPESDDLQSAAYDAISDILTALLGPAGWYVQQGDDLNKRHWNHEALQEAEAMLQAALRSYEGDSEDYIVEEEGA